VVALRPFDQHSLRPADDRHLPWASWLSYAALSLWRNTTSVSWLYPSVIIVSWRPSRCSSATQSPWRNTAAVSWLYPSVITVSQRPSRCSCAAPSPWRNTVAVSWLYPSAITVSWRPSRCSSSPSTSRNQYTLMWLFSDPCPWMMPLCLPEPTSNDRLPHRPVLPGHHSIRDILYFDCFQQTIAQ
jgi:hypothetical protein